MADISKYLSLVTPYHRGKPKFTATIEEALQPFAEAQAFLASIPREFDVDYAIGVQLDVVGEWVGAKRRLPIPLQDFWFRWNDTRRGWSAGVWQDATQDISQIGITYLGDDDYRSLIKAKIAANHWNGTVAGGQPALDAFFANSGTLSFIQDRHDLTMAIGVSGELPKLQKVALLGGGYIKLKPAAVKTYYWFTSVDTKPLFGFGMQNAYVSGWNIGAWGVTSDYIIERGAPVIPRADFSLPQNGWMLAALGMA